MNGCSERSRKGKTPQSFDDLHASTSEVQRLIEAKRNMEKAKKEVKGMWANDPINLFLEKQFNHARSREYPYCNVCTYFVPNNHEKKNQGDEAMEIPKRYVFCEL